MSLAVPLLVDRLRVEVPGARLLDGVDLRVAPGEAVALMGANGSGKSTLVRAALGIAPVSDGDAAVFGVSTRRERSRVPWRRVGYVPQRLSVASPVPATVREVVRTGLLDRRRWWARDEAAVDEAMDAVGVTDLADRPFGVLSGGQAQRVTIARALVRRPHLLVLDEPLAGVDTGTQRSFATLLHRMRHDGRSVLVVLHELGPFEQVLDRAVLLRDGVVVHDGAAPGPAHDHADPEHEHLHHEHALPAEPVTRRTPP